MRVLIVKMSSMGDVFHTFPALSDAMRAIPDLKVDWVVEKSFSEIPEWHPVVNEVFPIELRQWRRTLWKKQTRQTMQAFFQQVNQNSYDLVIDAQGLLKSLWVVRKVHTGKKVGLDWQSAREPLASLGYDEKIHVPKNQHAIERLRLLLSKALNYDYSPNSSIFYGLDTSQWKKPVELNEQFKDDVYSVFLHGTTWDTKLWPETYWIELLQKMVTKGQKVVLLWGNKEEHERSKRIAASVKFYQTWVPEKKLSLNDVAKILKNAQAVISVDTGLSHVAAALETRMIVMYRVTDPRLVGAGGGTVTHLESPCASLYLKSFVKDKQALISLKNLSVDEVFQALVKK